MTSRERVRVTLQHEQPDKVPIDLGAMGSTGMSAIAYARLRDYYGLPPQKVKLYDIMQQLAWIDDDMLRQVGGDVLQIRGRYSSFGLEIGSYKDGFLLDGTNALVPEAYSPEMLKNGTSVIKKGTQIVAQRPMNAFFYEGCYHPFKDCKTMADIDKIPMKSMSDADIAYTAAQAKEKREHTDYALMGTFNGNILEAGQEDWGFENFMVLLGEEPNLARYYLQKKLSVHMDNLRRYLDVVGEYLDIIKFGDDLGSQSSCLISPDMYRQMIKPYHQKQFQWVKQCRPDCKVFFHSCGAIMPLIDDLIDAGVDILNPIQISASGMNPIEIKKRYGKNLVLWGGGCDTQTTLPYKSPQEVYDEVTELVKILAPGGGYVFAQVHNVMPDVSPQNLAAMYRAINDYNRKDD